MVLPPRLRKLRLPRPTQSDAQAAPAKPKTNAAGAPPVTVTVTNSRKADLVQLQAAEPGTANWKKVLGPVKSANRRRLN